MKDRAIIELIDKWLDLRFPNADNFYRAEWHHRYEKCGIEFTIHMDGDSKHLWKKVYLEFLDAPTETKDHYHVSFKPELSWTVHVSPTDSKEDALSTFHRWILANEISIEECLTIVQSDPDCNYCNSGEGK